MDDLIQELQEELDFLTGSTPAQRRAMYRLGHSKWYVKRHCRTKQQSSRQIGHDIENYQDLHITPSIPQPPKTHSSRTI